MNITAALNEVLVKLFREIITIEEQSIKTGQFKDLTANDMHVMEEIGKNGAKNMTTVAKGLSVTTGTLTIAINGLVKKGYVDRTRSDEDRRVVLVSLSEKGKLAYDQHDAFHQEMVKSITGGMTEEEQEILQRALVNLNDFFMEIKEK